MAGQKRLGELLVEMGFIDDGQLESALEEQLRSGKRLGKVLVDAGVVSEERLVRALSRQLGIELCDPINTPVHPRVRQVVSPQLAHRYGVIPIALTRDEVGQVLYVATSDPLDRSALEMLRAQLGAGVRVRWMLSGETEIALALARHYAAEAPKVGLVAPSHFPPVPDAAMVASSSSSARVAPMSSAPSAPATSSVRSFQGAPVIQGVPISGPRQSPTPPLGMRRSSVAPDDAGDFEVLPLAGVMPQLDLRDRAPSTPSGPRDVRSMRAETSPPPITHDIPRVRTGEFAQVRTPVPPGPPLTPTGAADSYERFVPPEELGIEEAVLEPDEVVDSEVPLSGTPLPPPPIAPETSAGNGRAELYRVPPPLMPPRMPLTHTPTELEVPDGMQSWGDMIGRTPSRAQAKADRPESAEEPEPAPDEPGLEPAEPEPELAEPEPPAPEPAELEPPELEPPELEPAEVVPEGEPVEAPPPDAELAEPEDTVEEPAPAELEAAAAGGEVRDEGQWSVALAEAAAETMAEAAVSLDMETEATAAAWEEASKTIADLANELPEVPLEGLSADALPLESLAMAAQDQGNGRTELAGPLAFPDLSLNIEAPADDHVELEPAVEAPLEPHPDIVMEEPHADLEEVNAELIDGHEAEIVAVETPDAPRTEIEVMGAHTLDAETLDLRDRRKSNRPSDDERRRRAMAEDIRIIRHTLERFLAGEDLVGESAQFMMRVAAAIMLNEGLFDEARIERAIETLKRAKK